MTCYAERYKQSWVAAMIEWAKFRWEQQRIQRSRNRISRTYEKKEKEARAKGGDSDVLSSLEYSWDFELKLEDDEMLNLIHRYYRRQADRLMVPVPPFKAEGGAWEESEKDGSYHLTQEALHDLRSAIRAEKKARREGWMVWLAAFIGLIGALSGLIAIIKK